MNTDMQESCSYAGLKTLALCKGVNYFSIHAATSYTIVMYIIIYIGCIGFVLDGGSAPDRVHTTTREFNPIHTKSNRTMTNHIYN